MKYLLIILLLRSAAISAQNKESLNIERFYEGHSGCFVCYNKQSGEYFRYNIARCKQRFLPASTFKIPNSLVGLETKVITDENFVIKWDGVEREIKEWNRDQTLSSAIQYSVVPYYQELARRVGKATMQKFLNELDYGNKTIGNAIDRFWLDNSLKISADEQIEFLKKFYDYKLNISKRSIDIVKKIMPQEKYDKSLLKFKTGTGSKKDNTYIGWLVGYVEKENNVYYYAFNIEAKTYDEVKQLRDTKSREILKYLKIVE